MLPASIWIGFDRREAAAFAVARDTVRRNLVLPIPVRGLILDDLIEAGLYTRPTETRPSATDGGIMWDVISDAPMSTEFAISRFLIPELVRRDTKPGRLRGWALFMDCDVLIRGKVDDLFRYVSDNQHFAVRCVKHDHRPRDAVKMGGQPQTVYSRKNWSSVMLFNCEHPANEHLTPNLVNTLPGRDLHRFCWLDDSEIGDLGSEWNHLVGETQTNEEPKLVHFTSGGPWMRGYESVPYATEWRRAQNEWAR